jgi:hypothetical protein
MDSASATIAKNAFRAIAAPETSSLHRIIVKNSLSVKCFLAIAHLSPS